MKKIIIFDMDGVLIDSEIIYHERMVEFLTDKGFEVKEETLLKLVGNSSKRTYEILKQGCVNFYKTEEEYQAEKTAYFFNRPICYEAMVNSSAKECMKSLKNKNYAISIASSSPKYHIEKITKMLDIDEYLDYIVSGEDFKESKPNPEIYYHVAKLYDTSPENCLVVEDSTYGILAAKAAQMTVVAKKDERFGFDQSKADYFIENLTEILNIIEKHKLISK